MLRLLRGNLAPGQEASVRPLMSGDDPRSISCRNRAAGWQFVIDPDSRRVLAAKEHSQRVLPGQGRGGRGNFVTQEGERGCPRHFEQYVARRKTLAKSFRKIKYYVVDEFHRGNRKCSKKNLTPREKKRFKKVRTNVSELFNSWIRRKNFIFNGMNAHSHRFWVQEAICFWNKNLKDMPKCNTRRTTSTTHKHPLPRERGEAVLGS